MITWTNNYSVYKATIGGVVSLVVNWEDGGYKVSAHGSTAILQLKNTVQDLEVGKTEALRLGKKLLKKAFEELGETQ